MSSEYDSTLFQESLESDYDPQYFTNKDILWCSDLNNSNYSGGVINIDTSALSNSGKFLAYKEAFLTIPFTIALQSTVDITATMSGFVASLKAGYWNLINSMSVSLNGTTIVEQQSFLNMFVNYKVLSSWDLNTLRRVGGLLGMAGVDSAGSYAYSAGASVNGNGLTNNAVQGTQAYINTLEPFNSGLYERLLNTSLNPVGGMNSVPTINGQVSYSNNVGAPYYTRSGSGATSVYQFHVIATIRLKDICDFFDNAPLMTRGLFRFQINYNALQSATITGTTTLISVAANPTCVGNTNPVLISSAATGNPLASTVALGASTILVSSGIGSATVNGITVNNPLLTQCRLYVPAFNLSPEYYKLYTQMPVKKLFYTDLYNFNITNVGAGSSFNSILSNTCKNPKLVIVIPQINSSANGSAQLRPLLSPFDTSPITTAPFASIQNFQVQVSGENAFQSAVQYDFDEFLNEVANNGSLLGGVNSKDSSGLISSRMWQTAYRYYVCDVGRRLAVSNSVDKSIVISGINNCAVAVDYYCFVVLGRELDLNIETGDIQKVV